MRARRRGYTLLELLVATASASVLMVGMSSALLISAQAMNLDEGASAEQARANAELRRVVSDLGTATRFRVLSAEAVEFDAPDRDGDGLPERLRYAWSGVAGDPLTLARNGGTPLTVLRGVQSLEFDWLLRAVAAVDVNVAPPSVTPVVEGYSKATKTTYQSWLSVPHPAGTVEGELLVAVLCIDGGRPAPWSYGAWTQLSGSPWVHSGESVTLSVWSKKVAAGEPTSHAWDWYPDSAAVGYILRISGQHKTTPFVAAVASEASGKSSTPDCPATSTTTECNLVLRLGAFDDDRVNEGSPGLAGHTPVLMTAVSSCVSGGAGHRDWLAAGAIPESEFSLKNSRDYRALTLVIAPEEE